MNGLFSPLATCRYNEQGCGMNIKTFGVTGYHQNPVPNTFLVQPDLSGHLGIILPGYRHSADMADLHYAGRMLVEQGADLLRVEYAYFRTDYMTQSEAIQEEWLRSDVLAVCGAGLLHRAYEKITLVGKSLGTLAMGHLLADSRFQRADCIWSTPILENPGLRSRIEQVRPRSLFIIGTADSHYQPGILRQLVEVTGGRSLVLDRVDHGLGIPGDIPGSLAALNNIVEAYRAFLGEAQD
jgi:hypothetical protein